MKEFYILILLFYCYSFIGWLIEIVVTLLKMHKFVNRGFLIGPMCPIYGFWWSSNNTAFKQLCKRSFSFVHNGDCSMCNP